MICVGPRLANPIFGSLYAATGKAFAFTEIEKVADANCRKIREIVRVYVRKRVSGENKSALGNKSDLLSLFLD